MYHDVECRLPAEKQEVPDIDASVHLGNIHDAWSCGAPMCVTRVLHHCTIYQHTIYTHDIAGQNII